MWYKLHDLCRYVILTDVEDSCKCILTKSGMFIVRSLCCAMKKSQVKVPYRKIWILINPLNKVFLWLAFRKCILKKSVLLSIGWNDSKCMFCSDVETINHFFTCLVYCGTIGLFLDVHLTSILFLDSFDNLLVWIESFFLKNKILT